MIGLRPAERIAIIATRLAVAAVIAGIALALLHHLARHRLGAVAQRIERLALLFECGIAAALAQRAGRTIHRLAGLAEGLWRRHALLAEAAHQVFQHSTQGALLLRQGPALPAALALLLAVRIAILRLAILAARHAQGLIHELLLKVHRAGW